VVVLGGGVVDVGVSEVVVVDTLLVVEVSELVAVDEEVVLESVVLV